VTTTVKLQNTLLWSIVTLWYSTGSVKIILQFAVHRGSLEYLHDGIKDCLHEDIIVIIIIIKHF